MSAPVQVLCVESDAAVLEVLCRVLGEFKPLTASRPAEALHLLKQHPSIGVVLSENRFHGDKDGIGFLAGLREAAPEVVAVLLSGNLDVDTAARAVREARVFRLLRKPCTKNDLVEAVRDAAHEHAMVRRERGHVHEVVRGFLAAISELLALSMPAAYGRAVRVRGIVSDLAEALNLDDAEAAETAAMLCTAGWVTLPSDMARKIYLGEELTLEEEVLADVLPDRSAGLFEDIPGLEEAREIIAHQDATFGPDDKRSKEIPEGARLLKIALDYDRLETSGLSANDALEKIVSGGRAYDRRVLHAFVEWHERTADVRVRRVPVAELEEGMQLAEDLRASTGIVLVPRGQSIGPGQLAKLGGLPADAFAEAMVAVARPRNDLHFDETEGGAA